MPWMGTCGGGEGMWCGAMWQGVGGVVAGCGGMWQGVGYVVGGQTYVMDGDMWQGWDMW